MESHSWTSSFLSWQSVLVLVAILGFWVSPSPYAPQRPAAPGEVQEEQIPVHYYARLWEDPWKALGRETGPGELNKNHVQPVDQNIEEALGAVLREKKEILGDEDAPICVLPVIVRGDAHSADASEMRTRFRISVISGLGASGYTAEDADHMILAKTTDGRVVLPIDLFVQSGLPRETKCTYKAVFVIWIPDHLVFNKPLAWFQNLREQCECAAGARPLHFKIIGPYWSGLLSDMMHEFKNYPDIAKGLTFYSSSATMADAVLDYLTFPKSAEDKTDDGKIGRQRFAVARTETSEASKGLKFHSLTCTDDQLALALLHELELRGVNPLAEDTRIAIIADWDTEYGRSLPLTFAAVLQKQISQNHQHIESVGPLTSVEIGKLYLDKLSWPPQILRAHYLSGLDGELSSHGDDKKENKGEAQPSPKLFSQAPKGLERADGAHQIDYIRRLAYTLANRIREHDRPRHAAGRLKAIGILGADVYDKLLLIQALRPLFPEAIFFTEDLDARFLNQPYTRNLVVASPFGFELFRTFQLGVPPFRDSDQTGTFLAVQMAMADLPEIPGEIREQLNPLLFEIGRTQAIPLLVPWTVQHNDLKTDLEADSDPWKGLLHPQYSR